ncbi:hypothetical protein CUMW_009030, partial [Citrus unshiu]
MFWRMAGLSTASPLLRKLRIF